MVIKIKYVVFNKSFYQNKVLPQSISQPWTNFVYHHKQNSERDHVRALHIGSRI